MVSKFFLCHSCHRVVPFIDKEPVKKCPSCGSGNGEIITGDRVKEGMDSGVYFDIDPRTGKRAKKKRR